MRGEGGCGGKRGYLSERRNSQVMDGLRNVTLNKNATKTLLLAMRTKDNEKKKSKREEGGEQRER